MNKEIYEVMKKYAQEMMELNYSVGTVPKMLWETDEGVFGTRDGASFKTLHESDIEELNMEHVPTNTDGKSKAVLYTQTPYCQKWLKKGKGFSASLDDMAQLVGLRVFVVDATQKPAKVVKQMRKALRHSTACFVFVGYNKKGEPQGYTVTTGRTLYEAFTTMTVLEKSAEVAWKARYIGGSKPIDRLEARLMKISYNKNYSKEENEYKSTEGKEA